MAPHQRLGRQDKVGVYPPPFEYVKAESLEHALEVLAAHAPNVRVLAGGQSLLPQLKLRTIFPDVIVDIGGLRDLAYVRERGAGLEIGALTRHVDILSRDWPASIALLTDAASVIGDVQVRNRGTVCGALAYADPVGDWGPVFAALDASVRVGKRGSEREVAVSELFAGAFETVIGRDEIITSIIVPAQPEGSSSAYLKLGRRIGDFGLVTIAVSLTMDGDVCHTAGIGVGGVGVSPVKAREAEAYLAGKPLDGATLEAAALLVQSVTTAMDDVRASAEYRLAMVPVIFRRAVEAARHRSAGEAVSAGFV